MKFQLLDVVTLMKRAVVRFVICNNYCEKGRNTYSLIAQPASQLLQILMVRKLCVAAEFC